MPTMDAGAKKYPQVRVTELADEHIKKVIRILRSRGLSVSKTSYLSELILSQPIPSAPAVKKKRRTRKAQSPDSVVQAL